MPMSPRLRRFTLTAHVTFSVGWLGAVVAYLALAVAGLTSEDAQVTRAVYPAMELLGWFVVVPFSLAALLTGLVQSLGSVWGLFRHYWVVAKFALTLGAIVVLLVRAEGFFGSLGMLGSRAGTALASSEGGMLPTQLVVHAGVGLMVLLTTTALSVYKPWGKTPYGLRRQQERREGSLPNPTRPPATPSHRPERDDGVGPEQSQWSRTGVPKLYVMLGIIGLVLLFVVLHVAGGGLRGH
jgi:hypothetical protein